MGNGVICKGVIHVGSFPGLVVLVRGCSSPWVITSKTVWCRGLRTGTLTVSVALTVASAYPARSDGNVIDSASREMGPPGSLLNDLDKFSEESRPTSARMLRVTQDDDDGVIRVDDDPIMRTAPLGVLSGAVVGVVTALPSG